ncbi:MAG: HEPN domain-containing protein [Thermoanaerobaculia bacterium]
MANRAQDWLRQAKADLAHARLARDGGSFEWSCFAAQQAAEKAVKAAYYHLGMEAWGHSVNSLLGALPEQTPASDSIRESGRRLDKHYIPTRYPNGFAEGAPADYYTAGEAEGAISDAESILRFCEDLLSRP